MSLLVRQARPTDAGSTGRILYHFQEITPWMPKLYAEVEVIAFCGEMIDRDWVIVAELEGQVVGFLARDNAEICSLYLAEGLRGRGLGRALLMAAKAASPRLVLRASEANTAARRFYHRQGFIEIGRSDGAHTDEGLPEITLEWRAGEALT